jgi:putative restriction endonuclease
MGPQGIFKPKIFRWLPLSITTVAGGPYKDHVSADGLVLYKYRGTDLNHRDNSGLRDAMNRRVPLIYFHGVVPGKYLASWPVFIVADSRESLTFTVMVDDPTTLRNWVTPSSPPVEPDEETLLRRLYITRQVRQRLHQHAFRERVLRAYRTHCTCCRLAHAELLDAAHIIPDAEQEGEPKVSNGLALCKLHHAAFDANILGIRPDYLIEIRPDVLEEQDGPLLLHGLQGLHNRAIELPGSRAHYPDRFLLEKRFEDFKKAG